MRSNWRSNCKEWFSCFDSFSNKLRNIVRDLIRRVAGDTVVDTPRISIIVCITRIVVTVSPRINQNVCLEIVEYN
jgi:hypothetical protein